MNSKKLRQLEREIAKIKEELMKTGNMRPGSLTKQYRDPSQKAGEFYQLSYTLKTKSKSEYIRPQFVEEIRRQIETYKRFKKLIEKWISLSIQYSRAKMDKTKEKK